MIEWQLPFAHREIAAMPPHNQTKRALLDFLRPAFHQTVGGHSTGRQHHCGNWATQERENLKT